MTKSKAAAATTFFNKITDKSTLPTCLLAKAQALITEIFPSINSGITISGTETEDGGICIQLYAFSSRRDVTFVLSSDPDIRFATTVLDALNFTGVISPNVTVQNLVSWLKEEYAFQLDRPT